MREAVVRLNPVAAGSSLSRVGRLALVAALASLALVVVVSSLASAETVIPAGTYTSSQTWTAAGSPYNLTGAVSFRNSAVLTIEPGVVVKGSAAGSYLQIGTQSGYCCGGDSATLNALGTQAAPISFEAANASQGWGGIRFRVWSFGQATGTLQNVTISGATAYGVDVQSTSGVLFDNVTFQSAPTAGLFLSTAAPTIKSSSFVGSPRGIYANTWDSRPTITDTSFSGQTVRYARLGFGSALSGLAFDGSATAVELVTQSITYTSGQRVNGIAAPYELLEPFILRNQQTLTIDAGVDLRVVPSAYLQIGTSSGYCCSGDAANLDIAGTAAAPVRIDASGAGWGGIRFRVWNFGTATGDLRNVTLANASTYAADVQSTSGVVFDNVTFRTPGTAGLFLSTAAPVVKSSSFIGGQRGIFANTWDSRPIVSATSFQDQTARFARVGFGSDLSTLSFSGTGGAVELVTQNVTYTTSQRVKAIAAPYELLDWMAIRNAATLTIDPGVTLRAVPWAFLQVGTPSGYCCNGDAAHLDANGTSAAPIVLDAANATAGWGGVRFRVWNFGTADGWLANATVRRGTTYDVDVQSTSGVVFDNVTFESPGVAGLYLSTAAPTVRSSTFTGGQYGIFANTWDSAPTVTGTSFADQSVRHARVGLTSTMSGLSFSGTGTSIELITANTIYTGSIRLSPVGVPFDLLDTFTIRNGATLTLDPGLRLRLAAGKFLQIGTASGYCCNGDAGHLVALGTQADPILIESVTGSNATGWAGLRFRAWNYGTADGTLRNVTLADVNGIGVDIININAVTLDNVTITRTTSHGVSVASSGGVTLLRGTIDSTGGYGVFAADTGSGATITGTSFTGQAGRPWRLRMTDVITDPVLTGHVLHEVEYYGFDVTTDRTLRTYFDAVTEQPYASVLLSSFQVYNTATWTVLPGAKVLVENNVYINVGACCSNPSSRGNLTAEGTQALPISFSSRSGSNGATGWQGLYFRGDYGVNAVSTLRNVTVSFSRDDGIEEYYYGKLTLDNVTLADNARYGAYLTNGGSLWFNQTRISRSGSHGVYAQSSAVPQLRGGIIENSGAYGLYLTGSDSSANVQGTSFANTTQRPARVRVTDTFLPGALTNNTIRDIEYYGVDITSDRTMFALYDTSNNARYDQVILNSFTVWQQATWTLMPDVRLLVESGQEIRIATCCSNPSSRGNLTAEGTVAQPIYIGSRSGNTASGWYGFYMRADYASSNTTMRNVTIAYSRDDAIDTYYYGSLILDNVTLERNARWGMQLQGTSPLVTGGHIANNGGHGVYMDSASSPVFRGGVIENNNGYGIWSQSSNSGATVDGTLIANNTQRPLRLRVTDTVTSPALQNNAIREIEYWGVDVTTNRTLAPFYDAGDGARYTSVLLSTMTVYDQAIWTWAPDLRLLVENAQVINVGSCCSGASRGNLSAIGTTGQPIYVGSRSGNNASGWYGFYFRGDYAAGTSVLRNVTVSFSRDDAIDTYYYGSLTLDNVTLDRNARWGMQLQGTSPLLVGGRIANNNGHGIYMDSASNPTIRGGVIENNNGYGIWSQSSNSGAAVSGTTLANNTQRPFRLRLTDVVTTDLTLQNNGIREVEYWGVDVTSDRALAPFYDAVTGQRYDSILLNGMTVYQQATWTWAPGLRLLVENAQEIRIGTCCGNPASRGNLTALGTAEQPIYVGSRTGTAASGWYGFYMRAEQAPSNTTMRNVTIALSRDEGLETYYYGSLILDNVTLDHNARYGMLLTGTSPSMTGVRVAYSGSHGIYQQSGGTSTIRGGVLENNNGNGYFSGDASSGATILGTTLQNNTVRPFKVRITDTVADVILRNNTIQQADYHGVDITSDRTLSPFYDADTGAKYASVISSGFTVYNQATWTIAPDTRVLVENAQGISIGSCCSNPTSRGNLTVLGTMAQPVTFGAYTNNVTTGWYGLYFRGDYAPGTSVLRNVTLSQSRDEGIETYYYSALTLDNVTLDRNARYTMYFYQSNPTLRNVRSSYSGNVGAYFYYSNAVWNGGGVDHSASSGIYHSGCHTANFTDITVEAANGYGMYADSSCNGADLTRVAFNNVTGRPMRNKMDAFTLDVTAINPGIREVELWSNTIGGARTLELRPVLDGAGAAIPSIPLGSFTVNGGAELLLAPDLQLRFRAGEYMTFGSSPSSRGTLTARGTKDRPINVSGVSAAIGGWGANGPAGINFDYTTTSRLQNTTIDGAAPNNLRIVTSGALALDNVTSKRSSASGVVVGASVFAFVNDSNLTQNLGPGIFEDNGGTLELYRSNLSRNLGNGLDIRAATATVRANFFFENNRSGINATGGNPILSASQNYLWRNTNYGVDLAATTGSIITDNGFIENIQGQARATAYNRWNVSAPTPGRNIAYGPFLGGNSWSDYPGQDTDADGLGDTLVPYNTTLGPGADFFPVMGNLYADFSVAIPDVVGHPLDLVFYDQSRGGYSAVDQWVWDLGDGGQFLTRNVTHTFPADGSYPVQLTVANPHGQFSQITKTVHVDSVAPQTTLWVNGTLGLEGWFTSAVNVTINATDDRSGVNSTRYQLDGGNLTTYATKIPVTSNGAHNVTYHAVDKNGNVELARTATFRLDRTLPVGGNVTFVGTAGNAGWYVSDVLMGLNATDNVSGVDRIEYAFNATPNLTYDGVGVPLTSDGTFLLRYRPVDHAGLVGAERNASVRRDATLPAIVSSLSGPLGGGAFWLGSVNASLSASDLTSGLAYLNASLDGAAFAPVSGNLTVSGHGNHTLALRATDAAGNVNDSLTLSIPIDLVPPTSEHHLAGTLGANGVYISNVTVTFTGNDSGSGIDRYVYSIDDGPNVTYGQPVDLHVEGQHRLVYRAVDLAGNAEVVHEIILTLDLEAPATTLTLAGAPGQNGWFLSNVTANLTVDDYQTLDHIVFGLVVGQTVEHSTYTTEFPIAGEGVHNVTFHSVSVGGLVEEEHFRLVKVDLALPSVGAALNGTEGNAGWYVTPVAVTLAATDNASGVATTKIGLDGAPLSTYTGALTVATTGAHSVAAQTDDIAGRTFTMGAVSFRVDLDDPVTTLALSPATPTGANGWYTSSPTVTFNATDVGAGVDRILLIVDGGPESVVTGPIVLGEGNHTLAYRALDVAGRSETARVANVRVDLTPPSLAELLAGALGNAGWYTGAVNATLAPTDGTSGIASVFAAVDGGAEAPYSSALSLTTTRTHTIAWRALDAAGLQANRTLTVKVDRSAPTTTASITPAAINGWRNQVATVSLTAVDQPGLGSGVASIEAGLDGAPLSAVTAPFAVGEGFHNLSFRGIDVAGLVNATTTQALNVDLTPPSLSYVMRPPEAGDWYYTPVQANFTATDALSGVSKIEWWVDNGGHTNTSALVVNLATEGQHVLHVRARDVADLASVTLDIPYKLDLSVPTLTSSFGGAPIGGTNRTVNWYKTPVNLSLVASDLGAGVASTTYRLDGGADQTYTGPLAFATEGAHNLSATALDNAGRLSATLNLAPFGVDLTPPATVPSLNGTLDAGDGVYKTLTTLTFSADDVLSGVRNGFLKINTGAGFVPYAGALVYNVSGTYSVDYFATDVAGNAETVKRLVFTVFVDGTPPITNLTPPPTGWYGAPVTVALSAVDVQSTVQAVLYKVDGGELVQVFGNRTNLTLAAEGIHTLEYAALDIAGNAELFRTATYRVDLTPPALSVANASTPGDNGWIRSAVTFTPNVTDALSGPGAITARVNGVPQSVTGTLVLAQSGFYNVTFSAVDLAGLVSNVVNWSGRIDVDVPRPTVLVIGPQGLGGWHKDNVTVLLTASDALAGIQTLEYSWDNASWLPYPGSSFQFATEGVHWLQVRALDRAGNLGLATPQVVGLDRTAPVITTALGGTAGQAGWWIGPVTANTTAADLGATPQTVPSGVHNFTRIVDNGTNESAALPSVVEFATSGVHTLSGHAIDLALNGATRVTSIPIDLEDPSLEWDVTGEEGLAGWYTDTVTLTAASVDLVSGPAAPLLDGTPLTGPTTFSDDGPRTVALRAVDVAGRVGSTLEVPIRIDATPPTPVSNVTGEPGLHGWFHNGTTITLGMLDLTSGPGDIRFRVDNGSLRLYDGPFDIDVDGVHQIDWLAFDVAGNVIEQNFTVGIDSAAPEAVANVTGVVGNNSWFRSAVNITLDASDPTSGIIGIEYSLDGGAWLPYVGEPITIGTEGRHTLEYRALDGSGIPSITYFHEILIDVTTPVVDLHLENTLFIEFDGKLYVRGTLCIEVTGLDLLSGLSDLVISITGVVTDLIHIELEVGMHCFDLDAGGGGGGGGGCGICAIAADIAGNEEIECMDLVFDPAAPSVDIVRPFQGALNLQNTSIPLFSAAFGSGVGVGDPGVAFEVATPEGNKTVGGPQSVGPRNSTLAQTTLVAGTRVPVWVAAHDGLSPIRRVELLVDGHSVGVANHTENVTFQYVVTQPRSTDEDPEEPTMRLPPEPLSNSTDDRNEHNVRVINVTMPVYVFEIDTLALEAGDHEFVARAWDVPGNLAKITRFVGYVSPAIGNATVSALDEASQDKGSVKNNVPNEARDLFPRNTPNETFDTWEMVPDQEIPPMPEEMRDRLDTFLTAARIAGQLYDFLAIDDYAFVDRTVVDEMDAYNTTDEALASLPAPLPPLVFNGISTYLWPAQADQVTEKVPEEVPVPIDIGSDDEDGGGDP